VFEHGACAIVPAPAAGSNGVSEFRAPFGRPRLIAVRTLAESQRALGAAGRACYPCSVREGLRVMPMPARFAIEIEREADGRWIAEIPALPGVLAYGATREEAIARAKALALRVLAERLEHGEPTDVLDGLFEAA